MTRLLAGAAIGVAVALGLSGCIVVQVPTPAVTDDADPTRTALPDAVGSTADCTDADIRLTQASTSYTLTGDCGVVTIEGADITVDAGNLDGLVIRGDRILIEAAAVGSIEIGGTQNTVDAEDVGAVSINGDRNEIDAFTVFTVAVSGNDNEIDASGTGAVTQSGERNRIGD
jgi:hypothetical protein